MPAPREIKKEIDTLVVQLIESGLSDDQNFPFERSLSEQITEITFPGAQLTSVAMKDISYTDIYDRLKKERAYTVKMLDGALIQMMYAFKQSKIERHRLAFFPSPHLEEFQNSPEIYLEDEIYADIISKKIVPFPIRFDFEGREEIYKELEHPKSHLTLGQYTNCRIPVSAPLLPYHFIDFILRNFYHTAYIKYSDKLTRYVKENFDESIADAERSVAYLQLPKLS